MYVHLYIPINNNPVRNLYNPRYRPASPWTLTWTLTLNLTYLLSLPPSLPPCLPARRVPIIYYCAVYIQSIPVGTEYCIALYLSYRVVSCRIVSYLISSHLVSYHIISYHIISYQLYNIAPLARYTRYPTLGTLLYSTYHRPSVRPSVRTKTDRQTDRHTRARAPSSLSRRGRPNRRNRPTTGHRCEARTTPQPHRTCLLAPGNQPNQTKPKPRRVFFGFNYGHNLRPLRTRGR